jgi:hypothetical protein
VAYSEAYLGESLNDRAYDAAIEGAAALNAVMRQNAALGRLASGSTLIGFGAEVCRVFGEQFDSAAQFTFNLTGGNAPETIKPLDYFAGRVVDMLIQKLVEFGPGTGIDETTRARDLQLTRVRLAEMRTRRMRDFTHGMLGDDRMKKDGVLSIINNQTNSPGAIQQLGVGNFSQQAFTQQHQPLVAAIDAALASAEFAKLTESRKQGFKDIADVVKEEATKPTPDASKLKRWTDRLITMGTEVGMRVAVSEIGQILARIFNGIT